MADLGGHGFEAITIMCEDLTHSLDALNFRFRQNHRVYVRRRTAAIVFLFFVLFVIY